MENNKNKKSVKFQGDMLNFYDFIQVFVFTRNHHLKFIFLYHRLIENSTLVLSTTIDAFSCVYLLYWAINRPGCNVGLCWIKKAQKGIYTVGPYHKNILEYVLILFLRSRLHLISLLKKIL